MVLAAFCVPRSGILFGWTGSWPARVVARVVCQVGKVGVVGSWFQYPSLPYWGFVSLRLSVGVMLVQDLALYPRPALGRAAILKSLGRAGRVRSRCVLRIFLAGGVGVVSCMAMSWEGLLDWWYHASAGVLSPSVETVALSFGWWLMG